ncbi:hypothetical protein ACAG26_08390 [Mycobacterium sp. pUA109]|uniref:hypothetical protein n=1 Tax=Mycobacterium sp. pUA109 TaxID=3238982 RepID=UPI00351B63B5
MSAPPPPPDPERRPPSPQPPYGYPYPPYGYPYPPYPGPPPRPRGSGAKTLTIFGMAAAGVLLAAVIYVVVGFIAPGFRIGTISLFVIAFAGGGGLLAVRKPWATGLGCGLMIGWALTTVVALTVGVVGEIARACTELMEG